MWIHITPLKNNLIIAFKSCRACIFNLALSLEVFCSQMSVPTCKDIHSSIMLMFSCFMFSCVGLHGILQARILEWVAMPPPGDLPDPGIQPAYLMSPVLADRFFTISASWPGVKPLPPALGVWSFNHWTTREVPCHSFLKEKKKWENLRLFVDHLNRQVLLPQEMFVLLPEILSTGSQVNLALSLHAPGSWRRAELRDRGQGPSRPGNPPQWELWVSPHLLNGS